LEVILEELVYQELVEYIDREHRAYGTLGFSEAIEGLFSIFGTSFPEGGGG
jgi:hypothetical protein